jgi:hypothetical protein
MGLRAAIMDVRGTIVKELRTEVRAGVVGTRLAEGRSSGDQDCKCKCEFEFHRIEPLLRFIYLTRGGMRRIQGKPHFSCDLLRKLKQGCLGIQK